MFYKRLNPIIFWMMLVFNVSILFAQTDTSEYRVKEVIIRADRPKEEAYVGPYKQPEWTMHRRFPGTRVYIQVDPGDVEFEQWMEFRVPKSGKSETRLSQELEIGLPYRMQLDLYVNTLHTRDEVNSTLSNREFAAELRWAFANWGEIPGNPTLYLEYAFANGYDVIEPKILLGDELAPGWHWGLNGVYEATVSGGPTKTEEFKFTGALSNTLIDQHISLGAAMEWSTETVRDTNMPDEIGHELLIGPSFQLRIMNKGHLDIEPLWGVTDESKRMKTYIVFGWDL